MNGATWAASYSNGSTERSAYDVLTTSTIVATYNNSTSYVYYTRGLKESLSFTPYGGDGSVRQYVGTDVVAGGNASAGFQGYIGMCGMFTSVLTDYEAYRLEGYMAWAISQPEILNDTHIFRNRPPLIGD
jgi:hypothetical protein